MRIKSLPITIPYQPSSFTKSLGWLPWLCVTGAYGLFLVSFANYGSRLTASHAEVQYWVGLLLMILPISVRLIGVTLSRFERLGLVVFLGLALYLVKVSHSPFAFTFADELIHLYNARTILENKVLFFPNPILHATPFYPGLEIITASVAMLTGLPLFNAGLVVVGCARIVLIMALFLLYEEISGSSRAAGLGVLLFMGSSNFVYWSVQFSYESLSLPLAVLFLYALARRFYTLEDRLQFRFTGVILIILVTVVMTHHLTSYAVWIFLVAVTLAQRVFRSARARRIGSGGLVLIGTLMILTWLIYVGKPVVGYIYPVVLGAVRDVLDTVAGEAAPRELFTSTTGYVAPAWERWIGIGSVILLFIGLPYGLYHLRSRARSNSLAIVLAGAALAYFPLLVLRYAPAGWEISNRGTNYLFIGLAMAAGLAAARIHAPQKVQTPFALLFSVYAALIILGGIIAGWPPDLRLSQPYRIGNASQFSDPQGVSAAIWANTYLEPGKRVATDETNARLMLAYGGQYVLTGTTGGLRLMMLSPAFTDSDLHVLQAGNVDYVVYDQRWVSWDNLRGVYYPSRSPASETSAADLLDELAYRQFDGLKYVSRLLDSGYVAIYDVGVLSGAKPIP
jgi:hypothetical protein